MHGVLHKYGVSGLTYIHPRFINSGPINNAVLALNGGRRSPNIMWRPPLLPVLATSLPKAALVWPGMCMAFSTYRAPGMRGREISTSVRHTRPYSCVKGVLVNAGKIRKNFFCQNQAKAAFYGRIMNDREELET